MFARSYFGVGFLRGLSSAAEAFAPYSGSYGRSPLGQARSDWRRIGREFRTALGSALAHVSEENSESQPAASRRRSSGPITSIIAAHWSGPLPPPAELERLDQIIPGGADRLLSMAEKQLGLAAKELDMAEKKLDIAEKEREKELGMAEKELAMADKELTHRIQDTRRGLYLGWSLAMGAVITAAVVSLCHGPWQVSVAVVGIPMLGAVHALIQGRGEKGGKRALRWFRSKHLPESGGIM